MKFCIIHNQEYNDDLDGCPVCFGEEVVKSEELCKKYSIKYTGKMKAKRIMAIKPMIKRIRF